MTPEEIIKAAADIVQHGPARVLVGKDGEAVPWKKAHIEHNIDASIIFIRDDGWSIGAPSWLELDAFALWPREWVAYMRRPCPHPYPIRIYKPRHEDVWPNEKG